jgi:hypothetical protein
MTGEKVDAPEHLDRARSLGWKIRRPGSGSVTGAPGQSHGRVVELGKKYILV